jgi:hypothetical protein
VTSEHRVPRRTFVGLLAAGGAVAVATVHELLHPTGAGADAEPASRRAAEGSTATQSGSASDGVVVLGRAYLQDYPKEADRKYLLAHLPGIDTSRDVRTQLPALQPAVTADFTAGRVVSVQGWQLSRTEARAAAAVALGA